MALMVALPITWILRTVMLVQLSESAAAPCMAFE